ncbi:Protein of unknown function [Bacillus thuringiensis]|uniref:Uncharacterized protein n=1 Tax=Bacillus thuringiensis TaxID=1428 RepID=A0A1C4EV39_BACTU|nr:Protein of unknown function [Bacillus thuringiensis]
MADVMNILEFILKRSATIEWKA